VAVFCRLIISVISVFIARSISLCRLQLLLKWPALSMTTTMMLMRMILKKQMMMKRVTMTTFYQQLGYWPKLAGNELGQGRYLVYPLLSDLIYCWYAFLNSFVALYKTLFFDFDLGPLTPKIYSPKFALWVIESVIVYMDVCHGSVGQSVHTKTCMWVPGADPCCHDNDIWARRGV